MCIVHGLIYVSTKKTKHCHIGGKITTVPETVSFVLGSRAYWGSAGRPFAQIAEVPLQDSAQEHAHNGFCKRQFPSLVIYLCCYIAHVLLICIVLSIFSFASINSENFRH